MRKLIVKRRNVSTASLMKIKIFIENDNGEVELGSVKCKEVGSLKNGETGEYEIANRRDRVFVVFNKVSPNEYHAVHQIPAGNKNVELFTGPRYTASQGNSFKIYTKADLKKLGNVDGW
jgi:hypothetical protein